MSNNFQTEFQTTSFSEYKTTTSNGIKSQIYSSNEESSKPLENFEISNLNSQNLDFAKILPLKTLSTFNKDKSFKYKDNINSDYLNNFNNTSEQSNNFEYGDLKIESTSEVTQNIQNNLTEEKQNLNNFDINNLQNGENIISTDINNINDNFDLNTLETNTGTMQQIEGSNFQEKDFTQNFDINYLQENANSYKTSENNINNETAAEATENFDINNLAEEINANIYANNLKATEQIADITKTGTDNFDLNVLTNTNLDIKSTEEITKNYNFSEFHTANSNPSNDINNLDKNARIESNTLQTSEPTIDNIMTNENLDLNNLTSEINKNIENMNNFQFETMNGNNFDLNNLITNTEKPQNFESAQTFEALANKTTEITPSVNINTLPQTLESINDTTKAVNIDNLGNLDLNSLTTTNMETTKNIETTQILDSANPSFDINALTNTENIDANNYQNSETFLDNKINENFNINNLSSDIIGNININTQPTAQPTIKTAELFKSNDLDINILMANIEKEQKYNDYTIQATESASPFDIKAITETSNLDTNAYQTNESNDLNNLLPASDTNINSGDNLESVQLTTTTDNLDLNNLINFDTNMKNDLDLNTLTKTTNEENIQSLNINNFHESEYTNPEKNLSNNEPIPSLEINNLTANENVTSNIDINNKIEQTYNNEFQKSEIISSEANITNLEKENYNIANITPVIDSNTDLLSNPNFDYKTLESQNTNYQLENNNIIDSTSALQTNEFDINTFLSSYKTDISKDLNNNIETNELVNSSLQKEMDVNQITLENISNDLNNFATITEITPDLNFDSYQAKATIRTKSNSYDSRINELKFQNNLIGISPNPYATIENKKIDNKNEFSSVTPLQGKIVNNINEKVCAVVTPMSNFSITTYRPFEGKFIGKKNNIFNFAKIKKNFVRPKEYGGYKTSTYNPSPSKL